jgi:hypothetical protein
MKIITKLSLIGLATAFTASAMAFPFTVQPRNAALSKRAKSTTAKSPTIGIFSHGKGIGQQAPTSKVPATPTSASSSHRWR